LNTAILCFSETEKVFLDKNANLFTPSFPKLHHSDKIWIFLNIENWVNHFSEKQNSTYYKTGSTLRIISTSVLTNLYSIQPTFGGNEIAKRFHHFVTRKTALTKNFIRDFVQKKLKILCWNVTFWHQISTF